MDDPTRSWPMNDIEAPLAHDVVYGRGGLANNHIGNILFRLIVCEYKERYHKSSRHEKTALAECIVRHWRAQSPPGRFLKLDKATDKWNDVRQQARGKASQTFREGPLKMDKLSEEQREELKRKVEEFKAKISRDSTSLLPPPPPPSAPAPQENMCETPPQNRSTRDLKKFEQEELSPVSVMDMQIFPVEDVEEAYKNKRQSDSAIANFFQSHFPAFPLRRPTSKRTASTSASSDKINNSASSNDDADEDSKPPPSKKPAFPNPLAAFFGGLMDEKMPHGCNNTVTIISDNAGQQSPQEEEIVLFTPDVKPSQPIERTPTTAPCTNNRASRSDSTMMKMPAFDFGRRQIQPAAAAMPRSRSRSRSRSIERNIHLKKKMLAARRASRSRSIERTRKAVVEPQGEEVTMPPLRVKMPPLRVESNITMIPDDDDDDDLIDELDMSGRSLTMSSLGLEDLENDSVLFAFCNQASNHSKNSKTRSKASLDTFSVSSRSSINMMDIELEMGSLHELFQEQCDTGGPRTTTRSDRKPHLFEQAYANAGMPGLDDMDDDDMSCISFGDDDDLDDDEYKVMEREALNDDLDASKDSSYIVIRSFH